MTAAACGAVAGLCFGMVAMFVSMAKPEGLLIFIALLSGITFGACAVRLGGIAHQAPTALRMDRDGISGYYAEPATWDEIKDIGIGTAQVNTPRANHSHRYLGFSLHDPIGFRDRQSAWRRLSSWISGRNSGYHIVIPETLITGTTIDRLLTQAKAFKDAAP